MIHENTETYLKHVIKNYRTEHVILRQRRKGERILESISENISKLASQNILMTAQLAELFRILSEAKSVRRDRILLSRQSIPRTIWLLAVIFSIVWLLPFFALNIQNQVVAMVLIGGVTFAIIIVLITINDLASPFDGTWQIDISSWHELLEIFDPTPRIVFVFKSKNRLIDLLSRTALGESLALPTDKLSAFSREGFLGLDWKNFLRRIQRRIPGYEKQINFEVLYLDDLASQDYLIDPKLEDLPIVFLIIGDKDIELINGEEIMTASNLNEFEEVFNRKLKEHLPWF